MKYAIKDGKTTNQLKFIGRNGELTDSEGAYLYSTKEEAQAEIDKMNWQDWAIVEEAEQ